MTKKLLSLLLAAIIITGTLFAASASASASATASASDSNSATTAAATAAASLATAVGADASDAVYRWNLSVYSSKSAGEATLAYHRLPDSVGYDDDDEITGLARSITSGKSGDYEKVMAIHDWVAENIWYDKDTVTIGSLDVLRNRRSVCEGYSKLTAALLQAVGIPAKVIAGYVVGAVGNASEFLDISGTTGNHAWNEAYADGRWIILDTTWDSANRYENGVYSKQAGCKRDYFDISLKDFSQTHRYLEYNDHYFIDGLIIDSVTHAIIQLHNYSAYKENVTEIIIPDSVTVISPFLFQSCKNLRSVIIPQGVETIMEFAFSACPNLTEVIIPDSVNYIGEKAFWWSTNAVLYGNAGSYAEAYAIENSIPFIAGAPADNGDKTSTWAETEVGAAIAAGLVPPALQAKYTQAITRAEYCALAVLLYEKYMGEEITGRKTFDDTDDVNVEKLAAVGVVSGVGNNLFDPHEGLTREQAAAMLSRLADAVGKPLPKQTAKFFDYFGISEWARESVGQVQAAGIMGGVGDDLFAPKWAYTREQSIITMIRLWNVVNAGTLVTNDAGEFSRVRGLLPEDLV